MRLATLAAIGLFVFGSALSTRAEDEKGLEGTWRQETEDLGVSYWELKPKGKHTYDAQEYGLGGKTGIARLKGETLVIEWADGDGKVYYEWHLKGTSGTGKLVGVDKVWDKSKIRYIGK